MLRKIDRFLLSDDPRLRLLMGYWSGSALLYLLGMVLLYLQVRAGTAAADGATALSWFALTGVVFFFILVRISTLLHITPRQLAVMQAVFAILCDIGAYAVMGEIRGASLMVLLVVIVFCAFSLRPRATLGLTAFALTVLALTMTLLHLRSPATHPLHAETMHFAICAATLFAVAILTGEMSKLRSKMSRQKEELLAAMGKIQTLATIDELTSLANRRHMNEVLNDMERRETTGEPMCLALLDIDFFKNVNDSYGHAGGDTVLRNFAEAARLQLRSADVLARWGGEEFLLLLPDTAIDEADRVLCRMADAVRAVAMPDLDLKRSITFSAGLVQRDGKEPFADTISRADKAMYKAKSTGRNRVIKA